MNIQQSKSLSRFYIALNNWIKAGMQSHPIFYKDTSICRLAKNWQCSYCPTSRIVEEMAAQFTACGMDEPYPFNRNVKVSYFHEYIEGTIYNNKERLDWIEQHAKFSEEYGQPIELTLFYRDMQEWIVKGENKHIFSNTYGICSNATRWLDFRNMIYISTQIQQELMDQFMLAGLDVSYPFNDNASDYQREQMTNSLYKNAKRLDWIKNRIN